MGRLHRAMSERRVVVAVDDVVSQARVVRHPLEQRLRHRAGALLYPVRLVGRVGVAEDRQQVEDLGFDVPRVTLVDGSHGVFVDASPRAMVQRLVVPVERRDRLDKCGFALGVREVARLIRRRRAELQVTRRRRRPQRMVVGHGHAPVGHGAVGVPHGDRFEDPPGFLELEGVQQSDGPIEVRLDLGRA